MIACEQPEVCATAVKTATKQAIPITVVAAVLLGILGDYLTNNE